MFALTRFIVLKVSDHCTNFEFGFGVHIFFVEIRIEANVSSGNLYKLEISFSMTQKVSALEAAWVGVLTAA